MKRVGLTLAALGFVALAGVLVHRAGRLRAGRHDRPAAIRPCGEASDDAARQADLRYLQCRPRHWRYWLMQR